MMEAKETSNEDIELGVPATTSSINLYRAESSQYIVARRESSMRLGQRRESFNLARGEVMLNRSLSVNEITIAALRRTTSSVLIPTIQAEKKLSVAEIKKAMDEKDETMIYIEHTFSFQRIAEFFHTNLNLSSLELSLGLPNELAASLLKEFGPNVLTPPARMPLWLLFLLQFVNYFMILLIIAGVLSIIAYLITPSDPTNLYLGLLLLIVVLVTCYETFSQEAKSDQLMETFRAMVPAAATAVRNGVVQHIKSEELVVGDLIRLKSGDKIPADCRIIVNNNMKVDQSMITGESEAIECTTMAASSHPLEARNIIFNGSLVVEGGCLAVVIRTGDDTLIGSMVELTGDTGKAKSTLKADVEHFVLTIAALALLQAIVVFIVGCVRGIDPFTAFIQGFIIVMVANVPQGLPSTITAALFIVAERMGKQNVFVKKLDVIETLGSCSLICTDKTGTLTQNLMSVAHIWVAGCNLARDEVEQAINDGASTSLRRLLENVCLNSRVVLQRSAPDSPLLPNGDATELGLYRLSSQVMQLLHGKEVEEYRTANNKLYEIPFNSANKWQMSIHTMQDDNADVLLLKGAPDVLLSKCSHYMTQAGDIVPMDAEFHRIYGQTYKEFGGQGERVLGFAMRTLEESFAVLEKQNSDFCTQLKANLVGNGSEPIRNLCFLGLVTLTDPPRDEVPAAIRDCHSAGVKVVMVTGDHPVTAGAIARQIGLISGPTREDVARDKNIDEDEVDESDVQAVVIHGASIDSMTDADWADVISKKDIVFARTSPEQKLVIVKKFTEAGNIVAMTGDGVNDSPALKQAAIGVAMGKNGSDVAREAADIVLLDDNFASIVVGIREGRLLFANLKKSIAYTLAHAAPEVIPVLLWAFVGLPQAMGGIHILCIDLLTELFPASSLAFEHAENNLMQVPPRNAKVDKLVTWGLLLYSYVFVGFIITGSCMFTFYQVFDWYGVSAKELGESNGKYFQGPSSDRFVNEDGEVFTVSDQEHVLSVVQSTYYLTLVACQAVHIWTCRTAISSLFTHGMFTNAYTNVGVIVALCLGCIVVYVPGIQTITVSSNPSSLNILYASLIAFGAIFAFTEFRKWYLRTHNGTVLLKW